MGDLTGKVAVITGAGRGLGREEAIQLARQGARVVINDINRPEAEEAARPADQRIRAPQHQGPVAEVYRSVRCGDCGLEPVPGLKVTVMFELAFHERLETRVG